MADNKRQKEDFTTALKKQVGKVVPAKPARARETLRYTTDQGVEIEIVRGDESDAQWNALKKKVMADQQAAAAKSAREMQQNERDRAWQALNNPKSQFAPELGIDEKTRNALLQMDPDKAIDFVLARSRNAERQRDLAKKPEEPKPVAQEKPVEAPAPKRSGGTGTQTEDTLTVGSAEPGMSVRGNMARLMLGTVLPEMDLRNKNDMSESEGIDLRNKNDMSAGEGVDLTTPESRAAVKAERERIAREGLDLTNKNDMSAGEGVDVTPAARVWERFEKPNPNDMSGSDGLDLTNKNDFTKTMPDGLDVGYTPERAAKVLEQRIRNAEAEAATAPQVGTMTRVAQPRQYGQGGVVDPTMEDMPLSTRGKLMEAMEPVTNFAQGLGNAAAAGVNAINAIPGKFGRAVANTLLPDGTPAVADADPMDAPPSFTMPGQAPTRGGQVVPPGTSLPVADAPTPGTASGGVSMGGAVKTTKPGQSAAPAPVNPNIAAIQQATDTALAAGAASAEIESKALQDKADLMAKQERDILDAEKRAAEIQTIKAERVRKAEVGLASLQSRLAELEQQSIDPNRFWNNKSDGQKAMAVVAGALFGFTGQGMQWLQRLDSLVEQDIQTQFADFKRKEATLGKQVDIQNNIIALARQQGLDDTEALNAARASMKERYALQLENIAATSGSQLVQQKALQNAAEIRMGAAKDIEELRLKTQTAAADMAFKYAQVAKLRQETAESRFNMGLKAAGGGKAEKLEQVRGPQAFQIADLQDAIKTSRNMSEAFKRKASGLVSKLTALDPTGTAEASEYAARRNVAVQLVGRALEGGVLREGDIARYQDMIPKAGDLRGEEKWDQLIKELEQRLSTTVNTLEAAGFDVARVKEQSNDILRPRVSFTPAGS